MAHNRLIKSISQSAVSQRSPTHSASCHTKEPGHSDMPKTRPRSVLSVTLILAYTYIHNHTLNTNGWLQKSKYFWTIITVASSSMLSLHWVSFSPFSTSISSSPFSLLSGFTLSASFCSKRKIISILAPLQVTFWWFMPPSSGNLAVVYKEECLHLWIPFCKFLEHVSIDAFVLFVLLLNAFLTQDHLIWQGDNQLFNKTKGKHQKGN